MGGASLETSHHERQRAVAYGDALSWTSDWHWQGNYGGRLDNGCAAKGTCGLPYSGQGLGGGWQLCFA